MAWTAAILWLILIAIESSAMLSAANTSRIASSVVRFEHALELICRNAASLVRNRYLRASGHCGASNSDCDVGRFR